MKLKSKITMLAAVLATMASANSEKYITIGDNAPSIKSAKWLKGEPIGKFEKGKLYVVEFWATWCGPCKENIPHLTELAKKYKDVSIIGISVWESLSDKTANTLPKVSKFVADQGDKMDYHVAADGSTNVIGDAWMTAAGEGGIPCSFIVNKEGKVAWIGHPAKMEATLAKVIDGTYDMAAARDAREVELKFSRPIDEAMKAKDYKAALKAIDGAIAERPKMEYPLTYPRLVSLFHVDVAKGIATADAILKESEGAPGAYQMISSLGAAFDDLPKAAYEYCNQTIDKVIDTVPNRFMFMAMKAEIAFNLKDNALAIKLGEEASDLAEKETHTSPEFRALIKKNIAKYKAAK